MAKLGYFTVFNKVGEQMGGASEESGYEQLLGWAIQLEGFITGPAGEVVYAAPPREAEPDMGPLPDNPEEGGA